MADPIPVDTREDASPLAELAVILLSMFAQWEVTFTRERAAHAREVARANGRQVGRPSIVDPRVLARAVRLRDAGAPMADIVTATGLSRATLYRHMPPRHATTTSA